MYTSFLYSHFNMLCQRLDSVAALYLILPRLSSLTRGKCINDACHQHIGYLPRKDAWLSKGVSHQLRDCVHNGMAPSLNRTRILHIYLATYMW